MVTDAFLYDQAPFDANHEKRVDHTWRHTLNGRKAATSSGTSKVLITSQEITLNSTKLCVDPMVDLVEACRMKAGRCPYYALHEIIHVTGGRLSNLLRLNATIDFQIEHSLPVVPSFECIRLRGGFFI